jgi:hypothetical protein
MMSFYNLSLMQTENYGQIHIPARLAINAGGAILGTIMHLPDLTELITNSVVRLWEKFTPADLLQEGASMSNGIEIGKCDSDALLGEIKIIRYTLLSAIQFVVSMYPGSTV